MSSISADDIIIFLGPSLSLEEAKKVCNASYFPPAKQGDIAGLVKQRQPKVIGLIDGFFQQTLSVWHREILYALENQVAVFGSSSMGALRAAELDQFGMQGIGKIYELYRDKKLTDDDEVALIHGPLQTNYLNLSLPMVNIRFTLENAKQKEMIASSECDEWIAIAKSLYYPQRTLFTISHLAFEKGVSKEALDKISLLFTHHYIDQKKSDALLLLNTINSRPISSEEKPSFSFHHTPLFHEFFQTERRINYNGAEFSLIQLAKHVALHHPRYSELYLSVAYRCAAQLFARILRIEVEQSEIEKETSRFCDNMRLENLKDWLVRNHLTEEEFQKLMIERAKTRKIFRSQCAGHVPWRLVQMLLEELKLSNQYEEWIESLINQEEILKQEVPCFDDTIHSELEDISTLFASHLRETKWNLDAPVEEWLEEGGFAGAQELAGHVLRSKKVREVLKDKLNLFFSDHGAQ